MNAIEYWYYSISYSTIH